MKQKGLGRGLSALIPERKASDLTGQERDRSTSWVEIGLITSNRYQPRKDFNNKDGRVDFVNQGKRPYPADFGQKGQPGL